MLTFGFMTLNLRNENSYFSGIAQAASNYGISCFRFVPSNIMPTSELIVGEKYNSSESRWIEAEFPLPDILYDRCFYGDDTHSQSCLSIVRWLKTRTDVTFLGYGLPNKIELYDVLNHSKLHPYLLHSALVAHADQVIHSLSHINPAIIKPINGSQGKGIYFIKKEKEQYIVETDKKGKHVSRAFESKELFSAWLQSLLKKKTFLIQPYKHLTNKDGHPFDLRILLQKNQHGKWSVRGKGIREGSVGSIVSNVNAGGKIHTFEDWSKENSPSSFLLKEVQYILSLLPTVLEGTFRPLFEIGVDIGIAKDGSLWILDVNSKPGRKVVVSTTPEVKAVLELAPILYAKHLMEQKRSLMNHEKTISN
jgi:hypothetical protein